MGILVESMSAFPASRYVAGIFVVDSEANAYSFEGTGFVPRDGVLVTCWHCVRAALQPDRYYAAMIIEDVPRNLAKAYFLKDITQDPNGADLATARVEYSPPKPLEIYPGETVAGTDVWTFGYPVTGPAACGGIVVRPRLLKGYIARTFTYQYQGFGPTPAFEIDMLSPAGLSGAPVFRAGCADLVGVIFGDLETYSITDWERVNVKTGEREPEIRKVIRFGLAHRTHTLEDLRGAATRHLRLLEYLA